MAWGPLEGLDCIMPDISPPPGPGPTPLPAFVPINYLEGRSRGARREEQRSRRSRFKRADAYSRNKNIVLRLGRPGIWCGGGVPLLLLSLLASHLGKLARKSIVHGR